MTRPWRTIVTPATLAAALDDRDLIVLDVRWSLTEPGFGASAWRAGHLPGARFVDLDRELSGPVTPVTGRHPLPDPDAFRETASAWGVDDSTQVVAYDDVGGQFAARAWWLLRDFGHFNVAVLDGGIQAWQAEGLPVSTAPARERPRTDFQGTPRHMPTVALWDFTTRMPRVLVDARAPERYRGDEEPVDPVGGHIPTAVNAPSAGNLAPDGRFLPADALRKRFEPLVGDKEGSDVAVYCGSGVTATHDILALEIAGWPWASLYPGSWSEWSRDKRRAVRTGDAP